MDPERAEIRYFPKAEELAGAAAIELHGLLKRRNPSKTFGVALSGGRIAKPFYGEVVQACRKAPVPWQEVHFFWADERCVPPGNPESNSADARALLLDPLEIPTAQIHRIHGEADSDYAAAEAEAEMCRILPLNGEGQPVLDLVILGMGEDGHVASLFPGESEEMVQSPKVYRAVMAVKPPPERVTLGYGALWAAAEVWILASGAGKKEAFDRLLRKDNALPVSRVVQRRAKTLIFEDIAPV